MSNRNAHVLIGRDFNCGDIEWSTMQVPHGVQKRQTQQQLMDIIGELPNTSSKYPHDAR